jgi:hypothetical protein
MVKELSSFMCHFLQYAHHEFEFVFGDRDGMRRFGFFPLCLCTPNRGPCSRCRHRVLSACAFSTSLLIVLVEPFLGQLLLFKWSSVFGLKTRACSLRLAVAIILLIDVNEMTRRSTLARKQRDASPNSTLAARSR